jgi:hypothetical protein
MYPDMYDYRTDCQIMAKSRSGKSKLVEACVRKHIERGNGPTVFDGHGPLYHDLVSYLAYRQPDRKIVLIDPSAGESVVPWNPFRFQEGDPTARASDLTMLLAKLWGMENTDEMPNFERIAQMLFTWLAVSGEPIQHAAPLLEYGNRSMRNRALEVLNDQPQARQEIEELQLISAKQPTDSALREWKWNVGSTRNRLRRITNSRALVRMMGVQGKPQLDINKAIEDKAIILVNLAPSPEFDARASATFAALLLHEFQRVALAHAREERPYFLYLDECQNYLTSAAGEMLDQTLKTGLRLTLIHQHMGQFHGNEPLKAAIAMNAGIKFIFNLPDPVEASRYAQELFMPELNAEKIRRERTRFITEHELEEYETYDETFSVTDYGAVQSSTQGGAVRRGSRYAPRLVEISENPDVWARDEKLGQLSERLMDLEPGCCYLKTPEGTFYHEVPYVRRYWTSSDTDLQFMHTANTLAIPPAEADRIIKKQEESFLKRSLTDAGRTKNRPAKRPARLHTQE